ncbi:MAG: flagellar biosynthesis protein FliQ [Vallitaleaceae bacterium]|jgi:flagellar biosynthetic protein FliQ|nr:flagellar biosynthesis protein FliQ [Vallitaleaceae bacterium]
MNQDLIVDLAREAVLTIITVSGPLLLIALVIGLLVSIFQTVTSIQEQTLAFVPKIIGVFIGLIVLAPWIMNQMVDLVNKIYTNFSLYIFG